MNTFYDPYDIWAVPIIGQLKQRWSRGDMGAKLLLPLLGLFEVIFPLYFRRVLRVRKHAYAHVEAMLSLASGILDESLMENFKMLRIDGMAWGLPFGWYSKNGIYDVNTPYITNTPYVMEALLKLAKQPHLHNEAMAMFYGTWKFLESLRVMYSGTDELALSYAPADETRIVVNANSYAAYAYAMHALHGQEEIKSKAKKKCVRLIRWIARQQLIDGSWFYYADKQSGNFIDCFHSCFVVKNVIKTQALLPDMAPIIEPVVEEGWSYIRDNFFDSKIGMCRRFAVRAHQDPFRWDLYDQAEYLGLLVDFDMLDEAKLFVERIEKRFRKGDHWYCRVDFLGRRWGKDFMRWGIAPFCYHKSRMDEVIARRTLPCVE